MHHEDSPNTIDPTRLPKPKLPDYRGFRVLPGPYFDEREDVYFQVLTVVDGLSVSAQQIEFDDNWVVTKLYPPRRFEWVDFCRELAMGNFVPVEQAR